jgi:hypothetical protein
MTQIIGMRDSIPVSIHVWDCHIRLFANANGKMFDLWDAATERDKKRAEKNTFVIFEHQQRTFQPRSLR